MRSPTRTARSRKRPSQWRSWTPCARFRAPMFLTCRTGLWRRQACISECRSSVATGAFAVPTFTRSGDFGQANSPQSAFGPGGSLPSDYSVSPEISFFRLVPGLANAARVLPTALRRGLLSCALRALRAVSFAACRYCGAANPGLQPAFSRRLPGAMTRRGPKKPPGKAAAGRIACPTLEAEIGDAPRDVVPEGLGLEMGKAFQGRVHLGPGRRLGQGHLEESQRIRHPACCHNQASRVGPGGHDVMLTATAESPTRQRASSPVRLPNYIRRDRRMAGCP